MSAFIALALIVYSYRRYHSDPDALETLDEKIKKADDAAKRKKKPVSERD